MRASRADVLPLHPLRSRGGLERGAVAADFDPAPAVVVAAPLTANPDRRSPDPKGGVHGCTPFFDRAMDGKSKNPRSRCVSRCEYCRGEPFSLVPFLLGSAKEMNSAFRPKALALKKVNSFRLDGGLLSLLGPKKVTKERPFPRQTYCWRVQYCAEFPTRHPWLGRKPAGIHARRPSGQGRWLAVADEESPASSTATAAATATATATAPWTPPTHVQRGLPLRSQGRP